MKIFTPIVLTVLLQYQLLPNALKDIQKTGILKIGVDVGYQPFEMKNKDGNIIGFDIDIAQKFASELGVELQIINTEWDGVIPALLAKKFHLIMGGMTITEERKKRVSFSMPYIEVGQLPLINQKFKKKITNVEQLNSKEFLLASRIGTTGEKAAKRKFPNARYKSYQDRETGAMDVVFGRIDAFIYDSPYINVFNATKGKSSTFTFSKPFTNEPVGIAVNKNNAKLLKKLNDFLEKFKQSSYYKKRYQYWFQGAEWLKAL